MTTLEERVSRIEGILGGLATKEDLARLEIRLAQTETRMVKWFIATTLLAVGAVGGIVAGVMVAVAELLN